MLRRLSLVVNFILVVAVVLLHDETSSVHTSHFCKFDSLKSFLPSNSTIKFRVNAETSFCWNLMRYPIPKPRILIFSNRLKLLLKLLKAVNSAEMLEITSEPKFKIADNTSYHSSLPLITHRQINLYFILKYVRIDPD